MTMIADQLRQKARRITAPTPIDEAFCKSMMQSMITLNGVTFVAEGIMQGHQAFFPLARNAAVAAGADVA